MKRMQYSVQKRKKYCWKFSPTCRAKHTNFGCNIAGKRNDHRGNTRFKKA